MSTDEEIKACCAAVYSTDAVAALLGDAYHPGGRRLTRRLADHLHLQPNGRVVDVASGPGATAQLLALEYGVEVDGVDLAESIVHQARRRVDDAGLSDRVRFHVGEAEHLPLHDGSADAAISECAFCTFPDKPSAAAEFARVLRPGGRLGLADVVTSPAGLPQELSTAAAWVACIADARPPEYYHTVLADAGLRTLTTERCDDALLHMIDDIESRIRLVQIVRSFATLGVDVERVQCYARLARQAVTDGLLGYSLIVAEKR